MVLEAPEQVSHRHRYAIASTGLGAILRVDFDIYCFKIPPDLYRMCLQDMTAVTSMVSTI